MQLFYYNRSPDSGEHFILTAAHCVDSFPNPKVFSVQYASTKIDEESPNVVAVEKVIIHNKYSYLNLKNDIALMQLKTPIDMKGNDYRVKLPLRNQIFYTGTPTQVAGWGANDTGFIQEFLQKVDLQIFSAKDCREMHETVENEVFETNICAGVIGGGKGLI